MKPLIDIQGVESVMFDRLPILSGFIYNGVYMIKTAANMDLVNASPLTGESTTRLSIGLTTKVIPVQLKISLA